MNFKSVVRLLAPGQFHYLIGRSRSARQIYSSVRSMTGSRRVTVPPETAIFSPALVDGALAALRRDSFAPGFDLPVALCNRLEAFARSALLKASHDPSVTFFLDDVKEGRLHGELPLAMAQVVTPIEGEAVRALCAEPTLLALAARFLRYRPGQIRPRLFWSFVSGLTDEERRSANQTIDYHFDVDGYNFLYANFYLTDVDVRSGAHVLMKGSHRAKPIKMLVGSARQSDQAVYAHFGAENERVIEGPRGMGFVEDTSCFHKALRPIDRDRLMLQIRYS